MDEHSTVSFTLDLYQHFHRQYKVCLPDNIIWWVVICITIGNATTSSEELTTVASLPYTIRKGYQTSEKRSCKWLKLCTINITMYQADAAHKKADAEYEAITDAAKQEVNVTVYKSISYLICCRYQCLNQGML